MWPWPSDQARAFLRAAGTTGAALVAVFTGAAFFLAAGAFTAGVLAGWAIWTGVTVPVNTMRVVAGIGMAGSGGSASTKALRNFLNSPYGIAYDGTYLYISDTSNNRVRRVDATGAIVSVYTAGCDSPRQLTIVGNDLYVACYSSNIVRSYDMTTFVGTTFSGTGAAADTHGLV